MKNKLTVFRITLIVFIVLYVLALILFILSAFTGKHLTPKELFRISFFGDSIKTGFYIYLAITIIIDSFLVYSLAQLLRITDHFKHNYFFTEKIILLFKSAGKQFVIIAIIGFLASVFYHYSFSENIVESMLLPFFYHFMVLIIGFGLLIIEETQKRALVIKTENDLTI